MENRGKIMLVKQSKIVLGNKGIIMLVKRGKIVLGKNPKLATTIVEILYQTMAKHWKMIGRTTIKRQHSDVPHPEQQWRLVSTHHQYLVPTVRVVTVVIMMMMTRGVGHPHHQLAQGQQTLWSHLPRHHHQGPEQK